MREFAFRERCIRIPLETGYLGAVETHQQDHYYIDFIDLFGTLKVTRSTCKPAFRVTICAVAFVILWR
jgi:hypothetical protein